MSSVRPNAVHPWLPRFSQAITGSISLEALAFQSWPAVWVALALVALSLAGPRYSPVALLFRAFARPPDELEPAAPVRFAQGMAVALLGAAVALGISGLDAVGWVLVGLVAAVALFSAISGICVGCELYRLMLRGRHHGDDLREDLGLVGAGPWVVTAPGCARCEPAWREVSQLDFAGEVVRVDLTKTPGAASTGIRSVPALLAIGRDGRLRESRTGRLDQSQIVPVLAAAAT
jgi:Domain of unknown function (DUF4395)